jgi:hypothetical protein
MCVLCKQRFSAEKCLTPRLKTELEVFKKKFQCPDDQMGLLLLGLSENFYASVETIAEEDLATMLTQSRFKELKAGVKVLLKIWHRRLRASTNLE